MVPFVKTISRVTRFSDGSLLEYNLPVEMPDYKGAGAEFIPNHLLPHYENEVLKLNNISENEFVIGHIYGGIQSSSINPFSANQTCQVRTLLHCSICSITLRYTQMYCVSMYRYKLIRMRLTPNCCSRKNHTNYLWKKSFFKLKTVWFWLVEM